MIAGASVETVENMSEYGLQHAMSRLANVSGKKTWDQIYGDLKSVVASSMPVILWTRKASTSLSSKRTPQAPTAVNQRFSDTYAYGDLKLQFVYSCYLIKHDNDYLLWDTGHAMTMPNVAPKVSLVDQLATPQTLVCRCEEVPLSAVEASFGDGAGGEVFGDEVVDLLDQLVSFRRVGMRLDVLLPLLERLALLGVREVAHLHEGLRAHHRADGYRLGRVEHLPRLQPVETLPRFLQRLVVAGFEQRRAQVRVEPAGEASPHALPQRRVEGSRGRRRRLLL